MMSEKQLNSYWNETRAGNNKGNSNNIFLPNKEDRKFEQLKTNVVTDLSRLYPEAFLGIENVNKNFITNIKQYRTMLDSLINTPNIPHFKHKLALLKKHTERIYPDLFPEINFSQYTPKDIPTCEHEKIIQQRFNVLEKMKQRKPQFVVVTVTKNRCPENNKSHVNYLQQNFESVAHQRNTEPFFWLVIDNSSTDGTKQFLDKVESEDFVGRIDFNGGTGAPFHARNFGVDFITAALQYGALDSKSFILRVDSDDQLFDEFVLANLNSLHKKHPESMVIRSKQLNSYEGSGGETIKYGIEPHSIHGNSHPELRNITDIFDAGLPFGAYSSIIEAYNRYPKTCVAEDAYKVRLDWLLATSKGKDIAADDFFTVKRRFHPESDTSSNSSKDTDAMLVGEYILTGNMKTAFEGIKKLNDNLHKQIT